MTPGAENIRTGYVFLAGTVFYFSESPLYHKNFKVIILT